MYNLSIYLKNKLVAFTRVNTPVEVALTSETTCALTTPVEVAPASDVSDDEWMAAQATTFIELMTTQEAVATTTDIFTVEKLLDKRKVGKKVQYLVKWEGYAEPTWEDKKNIIDKRLPGTKKNQETKNLLNYFNNNKNK